MFRYAVLYFFLLVVFLALMIGPSVAGKYIPSSLTSSLSSTGLIQPTGLSNNDTIGSSQTGTGAASYSGALLTMTSASASASSTDSAAKIRLF